jgi:hypothetical protein
MLTIPLPIWLAETFHPHCRTWIRGLGGGNRQPTTYLRRAFTVTNTSSYTSLRVEIILEDGGVTYNNGREFARSSAPPFNTGTHQHRRGSDHFLVQPTLVIHK